MTDNMMSAEKVRAMLTDNLGKVRKASEDYFNMLEKGAAQLPIGGQAKPFTDLLQRNVMASFDLCDKLIQAKDVTEAMRIQSEFVQSQMRAMTDQARSFGESAMKAATGAFMPKS